MTMVQETILREKSIVSRLGQDARIQHVHSLGPVRIDVPALPTGRHFFELWPVRELPDQGMWAASHYTSFAPPVFVLRDVLVHSSAGILAVGDTVLGAGTRLPGTCARYRAARWTNRSAAWHAYLAPGRG